RRPLPPRHAGHGTQPGHRGGPGRAPEGGLRDEAARPPAAAPEDQQEVPRLPHGRGQRMLPAHVCRGGGAVSGEPPNYTPEALEAARRRAREWVALMLADDADFASSEGLRRRHENGGAGAPTRRPRTKSQPPPSKDG